MEEEQEKKQQYLRKEILEKNYDTQTFLDFLVTKKGDNACDINNWTIEELKLVVKEFINNQQIKKKANTSSSSLLEDLPAPESQTLNISSIISTPYGNKNKNDNELLYSYFSEDKNNQWLFDNGDNKERYSISNYSNINNDIEFEQISCLEPDNSPYSKYDSINIEILSPKKEYESRGLKGFFVKTVFYTFLLKSEKINLNIRRKYSDIEWLRKTLERLYPGYYIPPLPPKGLNINKPEKIEKYKIYLQKFFDELMKDVLFKNSSLLYLFLSTQNEKDLIDIMKKFDNVQRPKELEFFYSRNGKIILDEYILKRDKKKELLDIKYNISKNKNILENLNKSLKLLGKEIKQVSDRMFEISDLFKQMYEISVNNSDKSSFCKSYSNLSIFFKKFGGFELTKMKNISDDLKSYIKSLNLKYSVSFQELYNNFEYQHNLYFKVADNLKKRKENLYNNADIEKWELNSEDRNLDINNKELAMKKILPKDTIVVNKIKKHLIYYAIQLDSETQRIKDSIHEENDKIFKYIKDDNINNMNEFINFFDLMKKS